MRALALLLTLLFATAVEAQPQPAGVRSDRMARLIERGALEHARGDVVSALASYREAISAAPRRGEGYVALGELYMTIDEPKRALEAFEAGARAAGDGEALWLGLARAHVALGQEERALAALRTLREAVPRSIAGLLALAEAVERRGGFVEALSVRRALIDRLEAEQQDAAEQRAQVRALERIVGAAERTRTRARCQPNQASAVLQALARCP